MGRLKKGENDLATKNPALAKEWDYEKNAPITPGDVSAGSHKQVWWICSVCGNSWIAQINARNLGNGCRECGYKKAAYSNIRTRTKDGNTLAEFNPAIAAEWDFEKNGNLTPNDVTPKSGMKVWWKCSHCGCSYYSRIEERTIGGSGCSVCAGIEVRQGVNDLASQYPLIADEWDYKRNENLKPTEVTSKSSKKVSWICSACGHQWKAFISSRTKINGTGCPKCARIYQTSLREQIIYWYILRFFPDAINEYHPSWLSVQEEIDIYIPSLSLGIEYDGEKWHKIETKDINKGRTILKNGVRLIRIREPNLPDINDGSILIHIAKADKNNCFISEVIKELSELIYQLYQIKWEPVINLKKDILQIRANIASIKYSQSLAYRFPELIDEWDYEKNQGLNPSQVTAGNDLKVYWKCKKCGFSWPSSIGSRTKGHGCPACAGLTLVKGVNDFKTKCPQYVDEWDIAANNGLLPEDVAYRSVKKVWWICKKCGGKYPQRIADKSAGHKCSICTGKRIVSGINDLATNNPELAQEWDYQKNQGVTPSEIAPQSNKKVWWICSKCGHSWPASVYSRNGLHRNCPECWKKNRRKSKGSIHV